MSYMYFRFENKMIMISTTGFTEKVDCSEMINEHSFQI